MQSMGPKITSFGELDKSRDSDLDGDGEADQKGAGEDDDIDPFSDSDD